MARKNFSEEETQKIIDGYHEGLNQTELGKLVGTDRCSISKYLIVLKEAGRLEGEVRHRDGNTAIRNMAFIKANYQTHTRKQMAGSLNITEHRVDDYIRELIKRGEYDKSKQYRERAPKKPEEPKKWHKLPEATPTYDHPVKCTISVANQCVYGTTRKNKNSGACNYILCEGHSRGCHWKECTHFSKVSDTNPRRWTEEGALKIM